MTLGRLSLGESRFARKTTKWRDSLVGSVSWRDLLVRSARRDAIVASAAQRLIIHPTSAGTTGVPLRISCRRDVLVRSAAQSWIIHSASSGTTGVPFRISCRRDVLVRSAVLVTTCPRRSHNEIGRRLESFPGKKSSPVDHHFFPQACGANDVVIFERRKDIAFHLLA
jgi:hypothetical protein